MDIAYDNIWNIEKGFKVPRKARISISFTALHEGNPGTYPTSESGKEFPTFGTGKFVKNDEVEDPNGSGIYQGQEIGIRGLLQNIKRSREATAKPVTAGSTTPTEG